jgi:hypothetical protein
LLGLVSSLWCSGVACREPANLTFGMTSVGTDWRVAETLFAQPALEAEAVSQRIIGDVRPAGETFCIRVANMGPDAVTAAVAWDVSRFTGFRPSADELLSRYQRGSLPTREGTAVQLRGTAIGIWIDSDHPRPERGSLLPVCPAYWWWNVQSAPWPFRETDRQLAFSFDMQVPTAQRDGNAEVYVCAYFLLRDSRSSRHFWLGATLFDPRGADRFPDTVHRDNWEAGTGLPILFTALDERSRWLHPGPGSAWFTDTPFTGYRRFEFRVSESELRCAVGAMKDRWADYAQVSANPRDYQLTHFNVNPEVYAPAGSRGRLGLTLRDIRVLLLAPGDARPPHADGSPAQPERRDLRDREKQAETIKDTSLP